MDSANSDRLSGESTQGWQANASLPAWEEIFARHEAVLVSHRDMLDLVKGHIAPDGEAFRAVSTMLGKTAQAMKQLQVAQKIMYVFDEFSPLLIAVRPTCRSKHTDRRAKENQEAYTASDEASESQASSAIHKKKKRPRLENEENASINPKFDSTDDLPVTKRKRNPAAPQDNSEEPHNPPSPTYSGETEDISAEVQRRLRIKEDRRRKKENVQPDKRKRESLISNESLSPAGQRPQRKRARVGTTLEGENTLASGQRSHGRVRKPKK